MSVNSLKMSISRNINRKILVTKKQSPHIFFAAGVVGIVTATVLACRSTLKLSQKLDEIQGDISNIKSIKTDLDAGVSNYTNEQYQKDVVYVYTKAGFEIIKLYGPSVIIGAVSIGALTGSHVQLSRRNAALMAAYAAVQQAYDDYRDRVREKLGEEQELDIYRSVTNEIVKVDGKNQEVKVVDPNKRSQYARVFDECSSEWEKDPEYNRIFIECQQNYMNNLLQARGHVFLNEVYDGLGFERSKAGAVVGWVIGEGDNFIDFGLFEAYNGRFVNGLEPSVWLDFNVDGVIWDKI